jgi:hypothetical protein
MTENNARLELADELYNLRTRFSGSTLDASTLDRAVAALRSSAEPVAKVTTALPIWQQLPDIPDAAPPAASVWEALEEAIEGHTKSIELARKDDALSETGRARIIDQHDAARSSLISLRRTLGALSAPPPPTLRSPGEGSRMTILTNPEDTWDAYCAEVESECRSPQGAMAFAIDRLTEALAAPQAPEPTREEIAVPMAALDWLFGSEPDADGKWFGQCREAIKAMEAKYPRRYWWRSKFRSMIPALALTKPRARDEQGEGM